MCCTSKMVVNSLNVTLSLAVSDLQFLQVFSTQLVEVIRARILACLMGVMSSILGQANKGPRKTEALLATATYCNTTIYSRYEKTVQPSCSTEDQKEHSRRQRCFTSSLADVAHTGFHTGSGIQRDTPVAVHIYFRLNRTTFHLKEMIYLLHNRFHLFKVKLKCLNSSIGRTVQHKIVFLTYLTFCPNMACQEDT